MGSMEERSPLVWAIVVVGCIAVLVWIWWRARQRPKGPPESARTHLYENLSIEEAQRIVWASEEMTDAERTELSIERRVDIRKIREDLAAHQKQWGTAAKVQIERVKQLPDGSVSVWIAPLDSQGDKLVTAGVRMPPVCASCLSEPTRTILVAFDWDVTRGWQTFERTVALPVPYCQECYSRDSKQVRREAVRCSPLALIPLALGGFLATLDGWVVGLGVMLLVVGVGAFSFLVRTLRDPMRGEGAVQLLFFDAKETRIIFRNKEYSDRFIRANAPTPPRASEAT